ncbi:MAG: zinc-binding dehydrogenase [Bacteroidota bacterium]
MRALRYHRYGPPAEVLRLDDLPAPEPGPGQVCVRLTHRALNPADLSAVKGTYGALRDLPATGGNEGMGQIDRLGDEVDGLTAGQRVVKLGDGPTWQEQVVLNAADVLPIPDGLSDEAAAQLFVNPLTAHLLLDAAEVSEGDTLVQSAGASAVARIATEMAVSRGAHVVSVVRREDHADRLRRMGAEVVVAKANTGEARAALREAVGPNGARAALDPVCGEIGALLLSSLADRGIHIVYGALSGEPLPVSPRALIYRQSRVRGVWRSRWWKETPREVSRPILSALADAAARGAFSLPVGATFDLADGAEAARYAMRPGRWGKVLLTG